MTTTGSGLARALRGVLLALGVWVAFFALQASLSIGLIRRTSDGVAGMLEVNLVIAVLWATLSIAIVAWHRRVRALASNVWIVFAFHLPLLIVASVLDAEVSRAATVMFEHVPPRLSFLAALVLYSDFDLVAYVAVIVISEVLLVRRALSERQRLAKRLEHSLSRARLDYLEAQLQPHFLFNSLGAVSELAYDAPAVANRVLRQLTAIFRTALARKSDEVTLGEEIVGIEPYLDIQRIRFADWLTIEYDVDDAAVDCLLPRFVLQPLIENAIRHGLRGRHAAGRIEISAAIDAGELLVRVADNGVGLDAAISSAGRGIGLANVRDRLAILYGDDNRLQLAAGAAGGTIAELRVPARRRDMVPSTMEVDHSPISLADVWTLRVPTLFQRPAAAIVVTWLVCGLAWTQQSYAYNALRGRLGETSWMTVARNDLTSALVWAMLTPIVLFAAKRFPVNRDNVALRLPAYVVASFGTAVVHVWLLQVLTGRSGEGQLFAPVWQMNYMVDVVIFLALAAIGHRRVLLGWLHAREAASAALTTELAAAQTRAAKLQGIPPVLLHSLDGIAESARRDPALTERQLTRLADYLRLALECSDDQGMTPDRERALESAVVALRESGAYSMDLTLSA
ncbi:MAG TPA: histidine kinase [Gemmatimonadaceae bacterium]|jgi:sensor histidine kinase YesM